MVKDVDSRTKAVGMQAPVQTSYYLVMVFDPSVPVPLIYALKWKTVLGIFYIYLFIYCVCESHASPLHICEGQSTMFRS